MTYNEFLAAKIPSHSRNQIIGTEPCKAELCTFISKRVGRGLIVTPIRQFSPDEQLPIADDLTWLEGPSLRATHVIADAPVFGAEWLHHAVLFHTPGSPVYQAPSAPRCAS